MFLCFMTTLRGRGGTRRIERANRVWLCVCVCVTWAGVYGCVSTASCSPLGFFWLTSGPREMTGSGRYGLSGGGETESLSHFRILRLHSSIMLIYIYQRKTRECWIHHQSAAAGNKLHFKQKRNWICGGWGAGRKRKAIFSCCKNGRRPSSSWERESIRL